MLSDKHYMSICPEWKLLLGALTGDKRVMNTLGGQGAETYISVTQ